MVVATRRSSVGTLSCPRPLGLFCVKWYIWNWIGLVMIFPMGRGGFGRPSARSSYAQRACSLVLAALLGVPLALELLRRLELLLGGVGELPVVRLTLPLRLKRLSLGGGQLGAALPGVVSAAAAHVQDADATRTRGAGCETSGPGCEGGPGHQGDAAPARDGQRRSAHGAAEVLQQTLQRLGDPPVDPRHQHPGAPLLGLAEDLAHR